MVHLLKITGAFVLILGLQLNNIEIGLATNASYSSIKVYYEPPDQGGPDSSQAAGTR